MPDYELDFKFSSDIAEQFFFCGKRNICWVSGYGAGKTYTACQKILALLTKFPGYRIAIGRYSNTELKRTTMQTFFKVCPPALYDEAYGGKRVDFLGYVT
jgi:phage terminase large subunit